MSRLDRIDDLDDARILAEMMAIAEGAVSNWTRMGIVSYADGAYLELHARQSGLFKQNNESDETLRSRIQTPPDAVTPDLILSSIQSIVDANGGGTVIMIELPRDSSHIGSAVGETIDQTRLAAFANRDCLVGGFSMVIIRIPASANCLSTCTDALRSKRNAGKFYLVQEYH